MYRLQIAVMLCPLLATCWSMSPRIQFSAPVVVGKDYYTTGFQGFGLNSVGKTEGGWVGSTDGGKSWSPLFQSALQCCPWPPGGAGTPVERCDHGNTLHDGYKYKFNYNRGLANATCGIDAHCDCCRCLANSSCSLGPTIVGDAGAVVLDADGKSIHNFGEITHVKDSSRSYTSFNASRFTRFSVDTQGHFVATVVNQTIEFRGLPPPGATCGDHGEPKFGCPFRTGGRGYVKLADGTLVMSIIVYLGGPHANPNPKLAPFSTSIVAYRSKDSGITWDYAGIILDAATASHSEEGPNENDLVLLADGKTIMAVIRLDAGDGMATHPYVPYVASTSDDGGITWSAPKSFPSGVGCARPRLLRTDGGQIVLSGGRLGPTNRDVRLWLNSGDGNVNSWQDFSVTYWHNRLETNSSLLFTAAVNSSTARESTSYTSLVRTGPQSGFITYARHLPPSPDVAFAMEFIISSS